MSEVGGGGRASMIPNWFNSCCALSDEKYLTEICGELPSWCIWIAPGGCIGGA